MIKNLLLFIGLTIGSSAFAQSFQFHEVLNYQTNVFDNGAAEIVAFDPLSERFFSTNGSSTSIDILDASTLATTGKISFRASVSLAAYTNKINSVTAFNGLIAVAAGDKSIRGKVLFLDTNGTLLAQVQVGFLPDMLTFYANGGKIIVANEGEPSDDYSSDPIGSVSIINIPGSLSSISSNDVQEIDFRLLDSTAYDPAIRIFGNNGQQLPSQDLEPEYIAVNASNTKAFVSLQENNALAIIDLNANALDTVIGLGFKDHGAAGNGLDASDRGNGINIRTYQKIFGMYQPDALSCININGVDYVLSANEGDARDYPSYSEETRIGQESLNALTFNSIQDYYTDSLAARLKITNTLGLNPSGSSYDSLFSFGTRSFGVWNDQGQLIWDSGDAFEQLIALSHPNHFNSDNDDNNSRKSRSDDKGPEPEAIATGYVMGTPYAFIGLERMGGVMVYNLTNPLQPSFEQYILHRNFNASANDTAAGDLGPEGLTFVPSTQSPSGFPLLAVANEVSGSVTIYELTPFGNLEEGKTKSISLYPNPSNGTFHLDEKLTLEVYDSNGKLILKGNALDKIDLSNYASGLYIVRDADGHALRIIKR